TMGLGDAGGGRTLLDVARVANGYAIEFIAPPAWLGIDAVSVVVPEFGSVDLTLTLNAESLADGSYRGRIELGTNDPANPSIMVPVELLVRPRTTDGPGPKAVPARFALHDNRPNPFNPSTTIAYDLPRASRVTLTVYDVRGREVVTLVSGSRPAGEHRAEWDGRDAQRQPVASGVYFCRMAAEGFVQTKKMVLLK
ncbi:MAG TPA: FlgD immunoglobulin-like domain containing protein, partial [Candidatus Krumholzibacteria bacterium]|nr:FlgD immunoglobulin-like domain containing protein [Candidatus Krumholzibacteria bacterium]